MRGDGLRGGMWGGRLGFALCHVVDQMREQRDDGVELPVLGGEEVSGVDCHGLWCYRAAQ